MFAAVASRAEMAFEMLFVRLVLVASKPLIERGCVAGAERAEPSATAAEIVMFVVEPLAAFTTIMRPIHADAVIVSVNVTAS
jgi:hypothetical protein